MGRKRTVKNVSLSENTKETLISHKLRLLNYLRVVSREQKQPYTNMKDYDYYEKERLNTILLLVIINIGLKHSDSAFTHTLESCFKINYNTFYHKISGFNFKANEIYNIVEFLLSRGGYAHITEEIVRCFKKSGD